MCRYLIPKSRAELKMEKRIYLLCVRVLVFADRVSQITTFPYSGKDFKLAS